MSGAAKRKSLIVERPSCADTGEVLIKLPAYMARNRPINTDAVEMCLLMLRLPEKQLAHMLRKRRDAELAAMVRTFAMAVAKKHGNSEQLEALRNL